MVGLSLFNIFGWILTNNAILFSINWIVHVSVTIFNISSLKTMLIHVSPCFMASGMLFTFVG